MKDYKQSRALNLFFRLLNQSLTPFHSNLSPNDTILCDEMHAQDYNSFQDWMHKVFDTEGKNRMHMLRVHDDRMLYVAFLGVDGQFQGIS